MRKITCDAPGCTASYSSQPHVVGVERELRIRGWTSERDVHLCPVCSAEFVEVPKPIGRKLFPEAVSVIESAD